MTEFLSEPFQSAWQSKDPFAEARAISDAASGQALYRNKEGRRTVRFEHQGKSYFLKYHQGIGWIEILKNLIQIRLPILGASNEFNAANQLQALGVDTLTPLAYGSRGINPATQESFLITKDLVDTVSLEDYFQTWKKNPLPPKIKYALIRRLAEIARLMHKKGINHRDFYLCHFLLEKNAAQKILKGEDFYCYLIDLHRCQIRKKVPQRWLEKDLAGLLFSSMDENISRRDYFRFVRAYTEKPLREALQAQPWTLIYEMAATLYQKEFGRAPQ